MPAMGLYRGTAKHARSGFTGEALRGHGPLLQGFYFAKSGRGQGPLLQGCGHGGDRGLLPDEVVGDFEAGVVFVFAGVGGGWRRAGVVEDDHGRIARFDLVGGGAGDEGVTRIVADDDQCAAGQLSPHVGGDQHAADCAVVGEAVIDVAFGLEPVLFDDLPHLRTLLLQPRLRIAFGRQRAVAFGFFLACALGFGLFGAGRGRRLAVARLGLLARDLGNLGLLDQSGLQQLFLQGITHGRANL